MKKQITLCNKKLDNGLRVGVWAYYKDEKLEITGQDLGVSQFETFNGSYEYEYFYSFNKENTKKLKEKLLEKDDKKEFLTVVKKHFSGLDGCKELVKYCKKHNIEHSFFSMCR